MSSSIPQTSGIYKITCIPTGKVYVGSAIDLNRRWLEHRAALRCGRHWNDYFQKAWNKYGEASFHFQIIELVLSAFVIEREQYWIDRLQAFDRRRGFNISPTAGSPLGVTRSEETKQLLSRLMRGRKLGPHSEEHKAKLSASNTGKAHPKWTPETRAKHAAIRGRGWIVTDPDGNETVVKSLSEFCREHRLTRSMLYYVAIGRYEHFRGWKCRRLK